MTTKTDDGKTETVAAAAAGAAPETKVEAVPSLLASGDASKAAGVAKPDAAPAAAVAEIKPEPAKAEGEKASTDSGEKPSTDGAEKADVKPADGKAEEKAPDAKAETKPDSSKEPAKADGAKEPDKDAKTETKEPEAPRAPPVYAEYKVPESFKDTFKLDAAKVAKIDTILGEAELNGHADHASIEALRQKILDIGVEEIANVQRQMLDYQRTTWNRMKEGWQSELKADPDLGGNRIETTVSNAKYVFENYFGLDKDQQATLLQVFDNAGVSDHPHFIRGLNHLFELLGPSRPVTPNLPSVKGSKEPGSRGWYDDPVKA